MDLTIISAQREGMGVFLSNNHHVQFLSAMRTRTSKEFAGFTRDSNCLNVVHILESFVMLMNCYDTVSATAMASQCKLL